MCFPFNLRDNNEILIVNVFFINAVVDLPDNFTYINIHISLCKTYTLMSLRTHKSFYLLSFQHVNLSVFGLNDIDLL